jgi:hypothetical protein
MKVTVLRASVAMAVAGQAVLANPVRVPVMVFRKVAKEIGTYAAEKVTDKIGIKASEALLKGVDKELVEEAVGTSVGVVFLVWDIFEVEECTRKGYSRFHQLQKECEHIYERAVVLKHAFQFEALYMSSGQNNGCGKLEGLRRRISDLITAARQHVNKIHRAANKAEAAADALDVPLCLSPVCAGLCLLSGPGYPVCLSSCIASFVVSLGGGIAQDCLSDQLKNLKSHCASTLDGIRALDHHVDHFCNDHCPGELVDELDLAAISSAAAVHGTPSNANFADVLMEFDTDSVVANLYAASVASLVFASLAVAFATIRFARHVVAQCRARGLHSIRASLLDA